MYTLFLELATVSMSYMNMHIKEQNLNVKLGRMYVPCPSRSPQISPTTIAFQCLIFPRFSGQGRDILLPGES